MATVLEDSPYGYIPTLWICVLFVVLFSLTSAAHLGQATYYRMWWLFPTMVIGGVGEIIGWAGRTWSSRNYSSDNAFYMNICCTIIAPSFMTAAMFIMMGRIIGLVGDEYSRLKPRTYSILFISADLVALVVQAVGGAAAASADTPDGAERGANIMVAGIIVQMAAITIYCIIQGDYLWRVLTDRPVRPRSTPSGVVTPQSDIEGSSNAFVLEKEAVSGRARLTSNIKNMLLGLGIATVFIYIRSIYRTIELLGGWNGEIFVNERLFNALDGMPIFVAMFVLNVFHPGRFIAIGKERNAVA
ncbi:hypothetical protein M407DRAFT_116512 [Tulasnella calospora MUT 4182]|uniref:RTA1 like protein n=1 Tax=Tulasnella calospora MUT 4182 TaxID=1051891 RepID=A0A0C3QBQ7_9AGAM|nr:hypothetical protein M407DRAFT_116512 [Tulasnella calospora MUT 4182]